MQNHGGISQVGGAFKGRDRDNSPVENLFSLLQQE